MPALNDLEDVAPVLCLGIESELRDVVLVALAVERLCLHLGMDETLAYQVRLCVTEAVNNVIEHAYGLCSSHRVDVELRLSGTTLRLDICDSGRAMPADALECSQTLEIDVGDIASLPTRGMGLFLIQSIMDTVEYRSDGTTNRLVMTKAIPRSAPAA